MFVTKPRFSQVTRLESKNGQYGSGYETRVRKWAFAHKDDGRFPVTLLFPESDRAHWAVSNYRHPDLTKEYLPFVPVKDIEVQARRKHPDDC